MCGEILKRHDRKFCSTDCFVKWQQEDNLKRRDELFRKIENGTVKFAKNGTHKNKAFKKYLIHKHGHKCMVCKRVKWMGKKIPLQLDHKDGDSENDSLDNIRIICPNCHAQTDTYCGKNKGNGKRKYRLEDYHKGKKKW